MKLGFSVASALIVTIETLPTPHTATGTFQVY